MATVRGDHPRMGNVGRGHRVVAADATEEFEAFDALPEEVRRYMKFRCPRKISALQITGELKKSRELAALTPVALVRLIHRNVLEIISLGG